MSGEQWVPMQFDIYKKSYNLEPDTSFYNLTIFERYSMTIYNAILQLQGNDIGPPNIWMVWTGSICLVSGALMNANVFGTIADIL
jgi:hypothetical protein